MLPLLDGRGGATLSRLVAELAREGEPLVPPAAGAPVDREAAQLGWAWRVVDEYRSALRFTELLRDLLEAEAPFAALAAVHALVGDELRHARQCARFSAAFGPTEALRIELDFQLDFPAHRASYAQRVATSWIVPSCSRCSLVSLYPLRCSSSVTRAYA